MLISTTPVFFYEDFQQAIPGQWIRCRSGLVWHHGIVIGIERDYRTNICLLMVAHAIPLAGVVVTTFQEFSHGQAIEIVAEPWSIEHQQIILSTALSLRDLAYALFNQNCEHFASYCFNRKAESRQVQSTVLVAGLAAVAALMITGSRAA
jgi:hypothetical protein